MMDTPENYYAILGVPPSADTETIKRAYRQLARRYHPDLVGPEGAIEMKRINRAYAVLGNAELRQHYDTIISGVLDLRQSGFVRPRPQPHVFNPDEDIFFSGLNVFSTRGPFRAGTTIHTPLGVITSLSSVRTVHGIQIAAGALDGRGMLWHIVNGVAGPPISFAADPHFTVESLRELRFSAAGTLVAGWGQLGLHVWDAYKGNLLWSYALHDRAVSAPYSIDLVLHGGANGERLVRLALPHLPEDVRAPRSWGVRATDVVTHRLDSAPKQFSDLQLCREEEIEKRQFWAIRLRALSQDAQALVTLSCASVPHETEQMSVVRRWNLGASTHTRKNKPRATIRTSVLVGTCATCTPPYAVTADASALAFVYGGKSIRICDTTTGTYTEIASGTMGGSARLALSPDAQWAAVAREDSEVNEGVIDLWSIPAGQIVQKFYHPWQISALHFAGKQLVAALTDGTIQLWE